MRFKSLLIALTILILIPFITKAEVIDNKDNRREYARSISQLRILEDISSSSEANLRKGNQTSRVLVLFRTLKGTPDLEKNMPEVLVIGPHGCFTAAYTDEESALAAVEYLRSLPEIIYAELDGEVYANDNTIDSIDDNQEQLEEQISFHSYGASEMGFGKATQWCAKAGIGSVTVAVIDSGVFCHQFLSNRLKHSGFDYVDGDEDSTNDTYNHGTHVAGIIVDCTPELPVYIYPIRILNDSGKGSIANATSAIFEAAEAGCGVINLSLTTDKHSDALEDAVKYALNCGCSVVASAGNNGENISGYCPVHMDYAGMIVVGACTGSLDKPARAAYSNYGSNVDVYAFGSSIESCSSSGGFVSKSGTSQAAPHISALCAILKQLFPSISCSQIESRIKALSVDENIQIPNALSLVPLTMGISAKDVFLPVGIQIILLRDALPETSFINLSWYCDDETIAMVDESGVITCLEEGSTVLHGDGPANADVLVNLHVFAENSVFHISTDLLTIEAEAFAGIATKAVYLPVFIQNIEWNAFEQSNLKTIFYSGNSFLFENMQDDINGVCIVTDFQSDLWRHLERAGIDYLISCGE